MKKNKLLLLLPLLVLLAGCAASLQEPPPTPVGPGASGSTAPIETQPSNIGLIRPDCTSPPEEQLSSMNLSDLEKTCKPVYCYGYMQDESGAGEFGAYLLGDKFFSIMLLYPGNVTQIMTNVKTGEKVEIPQYTGVLEYRYYFIGELEYFRYSPGYPYQGCNWTMHNSSRLDECQAEAIGVLAHMTKEENFNGMKSHGLTCVYSDFGEEIFSVPGKACDQTEDICKALPKKNSS